MSSKFFGGSKKEKALSPQDAIVKLTDTMDMLEKRQEFLEKKIHTEVDTAKKHGLKNKRAALQALSRKKRYEKQLQQIDGTLTTIECQKDALENASTNSEVLKCMQAASSSLKMANEGMDIDRVQNIMDDIQEQQQVSQEISDAISTPFVDAGYDQDELEAELAALEAEGTCTLDHGDFPKLPNTPEGDLSDTKRATKEENKELRELEAWAQ